MGSGIFKELKFCPRCGVSGIERDDYRFEILGREIKRDHNEFICHACGLGIQMTPSFRHQVAAKLQKAHRASNFVEGVKVSTPRKS
jgi:hypothetical protein